MATHSYLRGNKLYSKNKMRILLTGGNGFLGRHVLDRLVEQGHECFVIDDLSGSDLAGARKDVNHYWEDLRDSHKASLAVESFGPDAIYLMSANAAEALSHFSPIDVFTRNYNTFLNALVPAINSGVKRVVVTSSIAAYGNLEPPFKEIDRPEPEDIYGVSKYAMEQSLKILAEVHDFEYVITRPFNVIGEGQYIKDPYRNVVTIWMNSILKGEPYYIYGKGEQVRCFSYVGDVADALVACLGCSPNMTFNVGSNIPYTLNQLSDLIMKVTEFDKPPIHLPERVNEVKTAVADTSLAREHLDYRDTLELEEVLKRVWSYVKVEGHIDPIEKQFEITKSIDKIPENWKK